MISEGFATIKPGLQEGEQWGTMVDKNRKVKHYTISLITLWACTLHSKNIEILLQNVSMDFVIISNGYLIRSPPSLEVEYVSNSLNRYDCTKQVAYIQQCS